MSAPLVVDRLTLHTGPMSESEARRLAELVAIALGRIRTTPSATSDVSVTVPAQQGRSVDQVADVVARAIEAALRVDGGG